MYKLTLYGLLAGMVYQMFWVILSAYRIKWSSGGPVEILDDAVENHRGWVYWLLATTIVYLLLVEFQRPVFSKTTWDLLFLIHLPCAAAFFGLLLALIKKYSGLQSRSHKTLGRLCGILFFIAATSGFCLIYRMKI